MDELDVRPWLSSGLLWLCFFRRLVLVSFPPFDVQTSLESCRGIAWCGMALHICGYCSRLLSLFLFLRLSVQCLCHGGLHQLIAGIVSEFNDKSIRSHSVNSFLS
jgi:hypothetical protein